MPPPRPCINPPHLQKDTDYSQAIRCRGCLPKGAVFCGIPVNQVQLQGDNRPRLSTCKGPREQRARLALLPENSRSHCRGVGQADKDFADPGTLPRVTTALTLLWATSFPEPTESRSPKKTQHRKM